MSFSLVGTDSSQDTPAPHDCRSRRRDSAAQPSRVSRPRRAPVAPNREARTLTRGAAGEPSRRGSARPLAAWSHAGFNPWRSKTFGRTVSKSNTCRCFGDQATGRRSPNHRLHVSSERPHFRRRACRWKSASRKRCQEEKCLPLSRLIGSRANTRRLTTPSHAPCLMGRRADNDAVLCTPTRHLLGGASPRACHNERIHTRGWQPARGCGTLICVMSMSR